MSNLCVSSTAFLIRVFGLTFILSTRKASKLFWKLGKLRDMEVDGESIASFGDSWNRRWTMDMIKSGNTEKVKDYFTEYVRIMRVTIT